MITPAIMQVESKSDSSFLGAICITGLAESGASVSLLFSSCCGNSICHSRVGGNPAFSPWTPAFAGVTSSIFAFCNRYYLSVLSIHAFSEFASSPSQICRCSISAWRRSGTLSLASIICQPPQPIFTSRSI